MAKERRRRLVLRGSALSAVLLILGSVGTIGAVTLRRHGAPRRAAVHAVQPVNVVAAAPASDSTKHVAQTPTVPTPTDSIAPAPSPATPAVTSSATNSPLKPVLPEGTTTLATGMTVTRHDTMVVVSFDFAGARTRVPERFERLVRSTLPEVYGARGDSALRAIPDGGIARQGDLFTELSARGARIPVGTGWSIALFPISRPGRDGPLVTQYRVTVTKS